MKGLYRKYAVYPKGCAVGKADSSKRVDDEAVYIVLRVDSGEYVHACRAGVMAFARAVRPVNPQLHDDLVALLSQEDDFDPEEYIGDEGWPEEELNDGDPDEA